MTWWGSWAAERAVEAPAERGLTTLDGIMQYPLACLAGVIVGFVLGLIGGGGSLLAVPLLIYLVEIRDVHEAVGTSAVAVALTAAMSLVKHARRQTIRWRSGIFYAAASVVGAVIGATLGRSINSAKLLFLFALLMVLAGIMILRQRGPAQQTKGDRQPMVRRILGYAACTGTLAGFFGVGGGFLIVPGLIRATGMPLINAVGTSLISVSACASFTALAYAGAGDVKWLVALLLSGGGWIGSSGGVWVAQRVSVAGRHALARIVAGIIFVVAAGILYKTL